MTPSPPAQDNPWGGESSWHPSFHHAMTCHDLLYHEYVQYVLIKQVYTIYKYGVHILFVICLHELQLVKCFTVSLFYFSSFRSPSIKHGPDTTCCRSQTRYVFFSFASFLSHMKQASASWCKIGNIDFLEEDITFQLKGVNQSWLMANSGK